MKIVVKGNNDSLDREEREALKEMLGSHEEPIHDERPGS